MKCTFWHKIAHKLSRLFFPRRLDHGVPHVCFTVCSCVCMCVFLFMFAVLYHIPWRRETGCHGSSLNVEWIAVIFRCVRACVRERRVVYVFPCRGQTRTACARHFVADHTGCGSLKKSSFRWPSTPVWPKCSHTGSQWLPAYSQISNLFHEAL